MIFLNHRAEFLYNEWRESVVTVMFPDKLNGTEYNRRYNAIRTKTSTRFNPSLQDFIRHVEKTVCFYLVASLFNRSNPLAKIDVFLIALRKREMQ